MGMFDWYEPTVASICPQCGAGLKGWQGKDGPCELLVWRQGEREPVDQRVDDQWRLSAEKLKSFRLPDLFLIYGGCDPHFSVYAICSCTDGVWTETRLLEQPEDVAKWLFSDRLNYVRAARRDADAKEKGKTEKLK